MKDSVRFSSLLNTESLLNLLNRLLNLTEKIALPAGGFLECVITSFDHSFIININLKERDPGSL